MVAVIQQGVETVIPSEEARFVADRYARYCARVAATQAEDPISAARGCLRGAAKALLDVSYAPGAFDPIMLRDASAILILRAAGA